MASKPVYYEGQEFHNPTDPSAPVLVYRGGKFLPKAQDAKGAAPQQQFQDAKTQVSDIDDALTRVNFLNSGVIGKWTEGIPSSPAYNLNRDLDTIKARVGFDKLAEMRAASPTGGALGNVSEGENKMLQGVLGSVDTGQSTKQLKENIKRIKQHYLTVAPGITPETAIDLSRGETRTAIPKEAYYVDPQGNVRQNLNGDAGNPIIRPKKTGGQAKASSPGAGKVLIYNPKTGNLE